MNDGQIHKLVGLMHNDPHSVLGIHLDGDAVVIRAFRPEALGISVIPDFGGKIPMQHRHGGVFELRLNGRNELFGYLLEVSYPGGATYTLRDPYSFLPTLGEMDLHF